MQLVRKKKSSFAKEGLTVEQNTEARLTYIIRKIAIRDGIAGFFRGSVPRVVKVAPACAIMISSYEMGKRFFADKRSERNLL